MVANGDGDKSIWMTELGWSTATSICGRGTWTGQKPAGVSEAQQAANLTEAYHCLAANPYVETGLWFTLTDSAGEGDELDHYGLLRTDASPKPAWDAFRRYATQGDTLTAPCGDLDGPDITVTSPTRDVRYVGALSLRAVAADPAGVGRVTFRVDGRTIRNFTGAAVASGRPVGLEWQGAKRLALGRHTLTVLALDPQGNTSSRAIRITRVRSLPSTLRTRMTLGAVSVGAGGVATVTGRVVKSGSAEPVGQGPRRLAAPARRALAHGALGPPARRPAVPGDAAARAHRALAGPGQLRQQGAVPDLVGLAHPARPRLGRDR